MNCKVRVYLVYSIIIVVLVVAIPCFAFNSGVKISIGLHTVIWQFMWDEGKELEDIEMNQGRKELWKFAEYNLEKIGAMGGKWNVVLMDQKEWSGYSMERRKRRIEKIVEKHQDLGLDCVLRIKLDPLVYGISGVNNKVYSKTNTWGVLGTLLKEISTFYDSGVKAILIGNEVNGKVSVDGKRYEIGYGQYKAVLEYSYNVIKSIDSRILVGNHGPASHLLAHAYIFDLLKNNRAEDAYAFWRNLMTVPGRGRMFSMGRFKQSIKRNEVREGAEFVLDSLADPGKADFFQLHHYRSWKTASPLIQWVRDKLRKANSARPIYACEIGYLMPLKQRTKEDSLPVQDMSVFSERDQARELIKIMVTMFGNDVNNLLYWQIRWKTNHGWAGRLFESTTDPDKFEPLVAANAFSRLAKTLNGLRNIQDTLFVEPGMVAHHFCGKKTTISILWSKEDVMMCSLRDQRNTVRRITNLIDGTRTNADSAPITVGCDPIMVEWNDPTTLTDQLEIDCAYKIKEKPTSPKLTILRIP